MERFNHVVSMLEKTLRTKAKRHVLGGALVSVSLLFSGLALTVITLKPDYLEDNTENEPQDY